MRGPLRLIALPVLASVPLLAQDAGPGDAAPGDAAPGESDGEAATDPEAQEPAADTVDPYDVLEPPSLRKRVFRYEVGPTGDVFPRAIADPRRALTGIQFGRFDSNVEGAGETRWLLHVGERFGLIRAYKPGQPKYAAQIDIEVGVVAQFDLENEADNIGWDGTYGFGWSYTPDGEFGLRFGIHHDSSHKGDEFLDNGGTQRIEYTREEIYLGLSQNLAYDWRTYGEIGYQWKDSDLDAQEPVRLQLGFELRPPPRWFQNTLGWYFASDLSSFQENDFDLNVTLQAGFAMKFGPTRIMRFGVEAYDGRSWIGEFYDSRESYLSIGVWLDQ